MIKQKSEVQKFKEFVNVVKNWAGLKAKQLNLKNQTVKFLRSDNSSDTYQMILKIFITMVEFNMSHLFLTLHNRTK